MRPRYACPGAALELMWGRLDCSAGFGFGLGALRTAPGINFCIIYRRCRRWEASRPRDGSRSTAPPRRRPAGLHQHISPRRRRTLLRPSASLRSRSGRTGPPVHWCVEMPKPEIRVVLHGFLSFAIKQLADAKSRSTAAITKEISSQQPAGAALNARAAPLRHRPGTHHQGLLHKPAAQRGRKKWAMPAAPSQSRISRRSGAWTRSFSSCTSTPAT